MYEKFNHGYQKRKIKGLDFSLILNKILEEFLCEIAAHYIPASP